MSDAPKRPRRWLKKIVAVVVVFILIGGGTAGGYWWWQRNAAAQAASPAETNSEDESHGQDEHNAEPIDNSGALVTFEPFLVNLSGGGGSQFLRIKVQLVVDEKHGEEFKEKPVALMRVRSAILELLAEQTADALVTADGKTALKKTLQERARTILGVRILDVLFSDFVVQF